MTERLSLEEFRLSGLIDQARFGKARTSTHAQTKQDKKPNRNGKYNASKVVTNDRTYDSKLEAKRAHDLEMLQMCNEISDLKFQVSFDLQVNSSPICKYIADFTYLDKHGNYIVEDAKGAETAIYKLKKKLMLACHGIKIFEYKKGF
ncbi:DUF1064 domain-containing protein [Vibrio breoganii]